MILARDVLEEAGSLMGGLVRIEGETKLRLA